MFDANGCRGGFRLTLMCDAETGKNLSEISVEWGQRIGERVPFLLNMTLNENTSVQDTEHLVAMLNRCIASLSFTKTTSCYFN